MAFVQTFGAVLLGLIMSLLIYTIPQKESALYRLIFFAPSMIPTAITGMLFIFLYNYDIGILNNLLRLLGLENLTRAWLEDFSTVIASINIVNIYKNAGLTMLLSYASLLMIPDSMIEAVKIEGGSYFTLAKSVLLPLIRPIILMSTMYTLTLSFKTYSLVFTLTKGGPANYSKTVPIYMSETAFQYGEFGYSAALGVCVTVLIISIIAIGKKFTNGETYEY
jgi:raffinose/stachyose/melibiose transport system permease protein